MAADNDEILVVEDDEDARTVLVRILELKGFRARGFSNGAEARAYLEKSEAPRLIVLDIRSSVMSGPEFRSALLQDPRLAEIPVVIVTALDPSEVTGLSARRILRKPMKVELLLDVIRQNC
ncbi:MAG: response regulator [Candidatus Binataceae bacterium]